MHHGTFFHAHMYNRLQTNPAGTWRNDNVIVTSKQRHSVVWCDNDVIIMSRVLWEVTLSVYSYPSIWTR